jgi:hypothetical protein
MMAIGGLMAMDPRDHIYGILAKENGGMRHGMPRFHYQVEGRGGLRI